MDENDESDVKEAGGSDGEESDEDEEMATGEETIESKAKGGSARCDETNERTTEERADHEEEEEEEELCQACGLQPRADAQAREYVKLACGHIFHRGCATTWFDRVQRAQCPVCRGEDPRVARGPLPDQPAGQMLCWLDVTRQLGGHANCGTLVVQWHVPAGVQTRHHPNPGRPYAKDQRQAMLPDTPDGRGRALLARLVRAWLGGAVLNVGRSQTRQVDDVVIWKTLHLRTSTTPGDAHGWPAPDHFDALDAELTQAGF